MVKMDLHGGKLQLDAQIKFTYTNVEIIKTFGLKLNLPILAYPPFEMMCFCVQKSHFPEFHEGVFFSSNNMFSLRNNF